MCATLRSGSTLLCALLAGTDVAGRPQEFFERLARRVAVRAPARAALRPRHTRRQGGAAVSLWRAVQTRAWRAGDVKEEGTAIYHGGAIAHLVAQLSEQDEAWRAWFAANGIRPLTIACEDLSTDPEAAAAAVLDHLGVGPAAIPAPPLRRQGDDRSARWAERFRSEAAVPRV